MSGGAGDLTAAQVMTITEHLGMYEAEVQRLRAVIDEAAHYLSYADGDDEAAHKAWQVLKEEHDRGK